MVCLIIFLNFQWPDHVGNRSEIIKIWHGGIAIHGGLIGGFIAGVIVCKVKNLNPFQIGDIVARSIILAQGIGTLGLHESRGTWWTCVTRFFKKITFAKFYNRKMYINEHYYQRFLKTNRFAFWVSVVLVLIFETFKIRQKHSFYI